MNDELVTGIQALPNEKLWLDFDAAPGASNNTKYWCPLLGVMFDFNTTTANAASKGFLYAVEYTWKV